MLPPAAPPVDSLDCRAVRDKIGVFGEFGEGGGVASCKKALKNSMISAAWDRLRKI